MKISLPTVKALRQLGHDVLTSDEAGNANRQIPDPEVSRYAIEEERAVLTINRRDFIQLHNLFPEHCGIIVCTVNTHYEDQAARIDLAVNHLKLLKNQRVRINRG
jgi:predicted nuclease of predicted toxin-antitoxin system